MIRIKVCGITNIDDAFSAVKAGADAVGFVFHKQSPRFISASKARRIVDALPPFISKVGVFANERDGAIRSIVKAAGLDAVQFHGDEDQHVCHRFKREGLQVIKAFRVKEDFDASVLVDYHVTAFLFDTFDASALGGTGKAFNWDLIKGLKTRTPIIVSGGLNAGNVAEAIAQIKPYGVDVSSGVESAPGKKDLALIRDFVKHARAN